MTKLAQRKSAAAPGSRKTSGRKRTVAAKSAKPSQLSLLKYEILGLILIFCGIFSTAGIVGIDTGSAGHLLNSVLSYGFGIGRIVPALALILLGLKYIMVRVALPVHRGWGICTVLFFLFLGLVHLLFIPENMELMPQLLPAGGGLAGGAIAVLVRPFLGQSGSILALIITMAVLLMVWKRFSISSSVNRVSEKATEEIQEASHTIREQWNERRERRKIFDVEKMEEHKKQASQPVGDERVEKGRERTFTPPTPEPAQEEEFEAFSPEALPVDPEPVVPAEPVPAAPVSPTPAPSANTAPPKDVLMEEFSDLKPVEIEKQATAVDLAPNGHSAPKAAPVNKLYRLPSLSILSHGRGPSSTAADEVRDNARILHETLQSFNIDAKILHASQGPAVTRYELEPAAGIKVSKIVNLADDIALKLAATDVRIEAPIPGKAAIGIEVPNKQVSSVNLRDVLDTDEFKRAVRGIPVGLGKDIAGNPVIADLSKMPHLLVAGSTGSGKSVCINTLIASVLFKQRPEDVKLILIDPKVVELSNYNGIPHLLTPVVTDAKKAANVLRWAVREMDHRYQRFAETGTRDLARYNEQNPSEAFPFVVIIIDELADLMMVASNDVEDAICRLAQKARACGMHLVLATQRPSVDVLTGIIKANVPSRISFAVSSQIDSRTILDMAGAEKLIGKGDMLFYPMGASKPLRVQGAFISDSEIDETVEFIKQQGEPEYNDQVVQVQKESEGGEEGFFEDELMEQAVEMVMETGQASASMLQRRFRIGYTRAARLIDTMEAMHIVGPGNGSKARELLMSAEEAHQKYFSGK